MSYAALRAPATRMRAHQSAHLWITSIATLFTVLHQAFSIVLIAPLVAP